MPTTVFTDPLQKYSSTALGDVRVIVAWQGKACAEPARPAMKKPEVCVAFINAPVEGVNGLCPAFEILDVSTLL